MTIHAYRETVRASIATQIPALKTCNTHPGRFQEGELKRWALQAPCVLVAVLGIPGSQKQGGYRSIDLSCAAIVITRDKVAEKKDYQAFAIVETILGLALDATWEGSGPPTEVSADNLYSGSLDKQGVSIWTVTWKSSMDLAFTPTLDDLDNFETAYVEWDLAPADETIDAVDQVELEQE